MKRTATGNTKSVHVAVIGAGLAGSACAAGLAQGDAHVTLYEKSRNVGGRMATRRAWWLDAQGAEQAVSFDHGALSFTPLRPRFKAAMARAVTSGCVAEWSPRVHAVWPGVAGRHLVGAPTMSALCGHLVAGSNVQLERTVRRLQHAADGSWYLVVEGVPLAGPFQQVVIAMPPAQAAVLVAGHHDQWADDLMSRRMEACWTLMAVTDEVGWPWDAAQPERGPLAWVLRNDRVPGRTAPPGLAVWTAHATPEWSAAHLEDEPQAVCAQLQSALAAQLPTVRSGNPPIRWHHAHVHRWRYARPAVDGSDGVDGNGFLWDETLSLGVCGDFLAGVGVEAAWHSGDELADCMAASSEQAGREHRVTATAR